jgi:CheY-like chemotaxis protein
MASAEKRPEVLVLDDDHDLLAVLRVILEEEGYDVTVASDGDGALALLRSGLRPAVILLDLMMPGMNGWSFRDELLADPTLAKIPVVVLSGDHRSLLDDAPRDVSYRLFKPFGLTTLLAVLKESAARGRETR